jgi:hypothetical protein
LFAATLFGQQEEKLNLKKPPDLTTAPTVSFCELVRNSEKYNQKIVRIRAIKVMWWEGSYLYDPACYGRDYGVSPEGGYEVVYSEESKKQVVQSERQDKDHFATRVGLVLVGQFHSWNGVGYGHLNGLLYGFDVMRIETAFPIDETVPWSSPNPLASPFSEAIEKIQQENRSFMFTDLPGARKLTLALPDDFQITTSEGKSLNKMQFLESLSTDVTKGSHLVIDDEKTYVYGKAGIVRGRMTKWDCPNLKEQYRYINVFVEREGKWQIAHSQITAVVVPEKGWHDPCKK